MLGYVYFTTIRGIFDNLVDGDLPAPLEGRPIETMVLYGNDFDGDAMTFFSDELAHFSNRRNRRVMRSDVGNAPAA